MAVLPASEFSWPDVYTDLLKRRDLAPEVATWAMDQIMSGEATASQVAGFLMALRSKGETIAELTAIAGVMLEHAHRFSVDGPSLDIVGTGGDRAHTVNISTMSAIVAAGAGMRIVKHGNRAASSTSGTADVLEALGLDLALTPAQVQEVAERAGITFCFAQAFHPAMRHASPTRRELGVGTVFNALGPLTNPAQPTYAAVGVADLALAPLMAGVFANRGRRAAVFRGEDGLDELTIAAASRVWWVADGQVVEHLVAPEDVGLAQAPLDALRGGDAVHNAGVVRDMLAGASGPVRDAVVLNAGTALAVCSETVGADSSRDALVEAIAAGIRRAQESIDSGSAGAVLERWIETSRSV
ncbi:anthranilate phosphoribosyltransferase [Nostocoides jenkinsii]|uniref:Anthranilate phosphoribosyltransferase n=1 Tax=Nostocoides jenkinsii Ben 74 TaxID=1193518 RepID=A0A077M6G5_9MICO|nr:anthranilate phosphoribosyltransferase [Tetrasphaera jenkinsii]CCI52876.1 Anthranilate phosphoribosyltransferase [Tetrasphaera jenkinsii Ben 74]